MEDKYTPVDFHNAYKFMLFMFMAFTIYCCMRYLFLLFQNAGMHFITFNQPCGRYLYLSIFLNLYPLATSYVLQRGKKMRDGVEVGLTFNEETRRFGSRIMHFSIIIYLLIFTSLFVNVLER